MLGSKGGCRNVRNDIFLILALINLHRQCLVVDDQDLGDKDAFKTLSKYLMNSEKSPLNSYIVTMGGGGQIPTFTDKVIGLFQANIT